jgi:hypothetical protein
VQGEPVPAAGSGADAHDEAWVELLREGLTFDLRGLADGASRPVPDIAHRFDFSAAAAMAELEALSITPGRHLAGGERSMPVLKGILGLARDLTQNLRTCRRSTGSLRAARSDGGSSNP